MSDSKFKEFWVYEGKLTCEGLRFIYTCPQDIKRQYPANWDEIHVIDRSVLSEKEDEIKRLNELVQVTRTMLIDRDNQITKLKAQLWVAKDSQLRTYDGMSEKADKYDALAEKLSNTKEK